MEVLKRMLKYTKKWWGDLPRPYKFGTACLVGSLVLVMVVGLGSMPTDGMERLVQSDDMQLEQQVQKLLDDSNYKDYEVRKDGIYVRAQDRERLIVQSSHLVGDGMLYAFLRESNLTASQWQLQQEMLIANQRKLERMIGTIDSVSKVSVKITPASKRQMVGFQGPPATAAVQIQTAAGKEFTMGHTAAVANILAASVEGMNPEDVRIMDDQGRLYKLPPKGSAWEISSTQLAAASKWEEHFQSKVRMFYEDARVAANVKLVAASTTERKKEYIGKPVPYETRKEKENSNTRRKEGSPGIKGEGTVDTRSAVGAGSEDTTDKSSLQEAKSAVSESVKNISTPPGTIEDVSITVILPTYIRDLPEVAPSDGAAEGAEETPEIRLASYVEKLNQEQVSKVQQQVANATGIKDLTKVTVSFIAAKLPGDIPGPTGWEMFQSFMSEWGGSIFLWTLASVALWILYLVLKRAMPRDVMAEIDEMRQRLKEEVVAMPDMAVSEKEMTRMKVTIREMIQKNPRSVAGVLRRWISGK